MAEGVHERQICIDMSTIAPSAAGKVAEALEEEGVCCLDAAASGADVGAQKEKTLSIMVGGWEDLFGPVARSSARTSLPDTEGLLNNLIYLSRVSGRQDG